MLTLHARIAVRESGRSANRRLPLSNQPDVPAAVEIIGYIRVSQLTKHGYSQG